MARKDRAPSPPKRPQAPQRRHATADPAAAARRRRAILLGVGGAAVLAAVVALGALFLSGGESDARASLEDAGCTLQTYPALEGEHVADVNAKPKWNSNPPTSGPHHPQSAVWGYFDSPVRLISSVHNLEHGGVVIHYGSDVTDETLAQLRAFYDDDPNGLLVTPLPSLRPADSITLSAWTAPERATASGGDEGRGYLARCSGFDENAFAAFVDEHRYKGPERFPPDLLTPGS